MLLISTVGTSLLTAACKESWLVLNTAWYTNSNIPSNYRDRLNGLESEMRRLLIEDWSRVSAEINGINSAIRHFELDPQRVTHLLIGSDTFQSVLVTSILVEFLIWWSSWVSTHHEPWLNWVSVKWFNSAVKWLVRNFLWTNGILTGYQNAWIPILANTTWWFKPLASAIEWLSPLFARHVVSIFQWSNELYVRKPLSLDTWFVDRYFSDCLLLAQDEPIPRKYISRWFPENLLEDIDTDHVTFSDLGLALFLKNKRIFRSIDRISLPYLELHNSFISDVSILTDSQLEKLLELLGKVSYLLLQNNWDISILRSNWWIQYSDYFAPWIWHFRFNNWMRIVTRKNEANWWISLLHYWTHDYTEGKAKQLR